MGLQACATDPSSGLVHFYCMLTCLYFCLRDMILWQPTGISRFFHKCKDDGNPKIWRVWCRNAAWGFFDLGWLLCHWSKSTHPRWSVYLIVVQYFWIFRFHVEIMSYLLVPRLENCVYLTCAYCTLGLKLHYSYIIECRHTHNWEDFMYFFKVQFISASICMCVCMCVFMLMEAKGTWLVRHPYWT